MLAELAVTVSLIFMLLYMLKKLIIFSYLSWSTLALACLFKIPDYIASEDYFNAVLFLIGSIIFLQIPRIKKEDVLFQVTRFSALSLLIYIPFALTNLKEYLIKITVHLTVLLGEALGYKMFFIDNVIFLNDKRVEIILACTAIESIALFAGASLGVRADNVRKFLSLTFSISTIYILNLFRNVFVIVSYSYSLFGENSFYIAHHVISKVFATLALLFIAYIVFKILPELFNLINSLISEIFGGRR